MANKRLKDFKTKKKKKNMRSENSVACLKKKYIDRSEVA